MFTEPHPGIEACFRYGRRAEKPAIGESVVAGRKEQHLPLCLDGLRVVHEDPEAFWRPLRERRTGQGQ
jgi:hypothetical protein